MNKRFVKAFLMGLATFAMALTPALKRFEQDSASPVAAASSQSRQASMRSQVASKMARAKLEPETDETSKRKIVTPVEEESTESNRVRPEDVEDAVIHEPVLPEDWGVEVDTEDLADKGEDRGYTPGTINIDGYEYFYVDLRGNTGTEEDFDEMVEIIDQQEIVYVGENKMNTFFGHYHSLDFAGVLNPAVDQGYLKDGAEVVITEEDGKSRGYLVTNTIMFNREEQDQHFYGDDLIPQLVYSGNGEDMLYIQYCRWDYGYDTLVSVFGYRIW